MEKREQYRINLPHFQQPGQAYFVTWSLKGAVPRKAIRDYSNRLSILKFQIQDAKNKQISPEKIEEITKEYYLIRRKYIKAYDDILDEQTDNIVDLSKTENTNIVIDALWFFNNKKIHNYAFCVMPNHVHWFFETFKKDEAGNPVYLQDIMQSIKRFTANKINKIENRSGSLWQKESFDTTIRNEKHLYNAIEYTINNPVKAKLVKNPEDWHGTWWENG